MKSTFNICFYAKKDKQKAGGAYPLFARITVDGVASRFNTKLDVLPEMWDGKAGKAIGRTVITNSCVLPSLLVTEALVVPTLVPFTVN